LDEEEDQEHAIAMTCYMPNWGHHTFSGECYAKAVEAPLDESILSLKKAKDAYECQHFSNESLTFKSRFHFGFRYSVNYRSMSRFPVLLILLRILVRWKPFVFDSHIRGLSRHIPSA